MKVHERILASSRIEAIRHSRLTPVMTRRASSGARRARGTSSKAVGGGNGAKLPSAASAYPVRAHLILKPRGVVHPLDAAPVRDDLGGGEIVRKIGVDDATSRG